MKERYFSSKFLSYFYSDDPKTHFDAQSKSLTHDTYAGIYPIDIIESTSGVQDKNGVDIYESDIVNLQGFKKPLVVKHSDTKGFYLVCEWGEALCKAEFGDKINALCQYQDTLKDIDPNTLEVIGNIRNNAYRATTQIFTHRGYTSIITLVTNGKKQWLNGYVLFDKEMFFKLFPAFKDKPDQVNVDGFLNEPESSFFDMSENRSQLYTYEAFDFEVSIPITYAEFGYKSDILSNECGFEPEKADAFVVFGFSLSSKFGMDEAKVMQNIDEMIDLWEKKQDTYHKAN